MGFSWRILFTDLGYAFNTSKQRLTYLQLYLGKDKATTQKPDKKIIDSLNPPQKVECERVKWKATDPYRSSEKEQYAASLQMWDGIEAARRKKKQRKSV